MPTRSYLSQSESAVTVGLGTARDIDEIEIAWPGGDKQTVENPQIDRVISVEQKH
jgi:hypothetical protein